MDIISVQQAVAVSAGSPSKEEVAIFAGLVGAAFGADRQPLRTREGPFHVRITGRPRGAGVFARG